MSKWKTIGVWVLQLLLAFLFFNVGRMKIWDGHWQGIFRGWGYPENLYLAVGWWEMLGGLALLWPKTAGLGAMALIAVMLGADGHHAWRGEWRSFFLPVLLFIALLSIIAWLRWPQFLKTGSTQAPPLA